MNRKVIVNFMHLLYTDYGFTNNEPTQGIERYCQYDRNGFEECAQLSPATGCTLTDYLCFAIFYPICNVAINIASTSYHIATSQHTMAITTIFIANGVYDNLRGNLFFVQQTICI